MDISSLSLILTVLVGWCILQRHPPDSQSVAGARSVSRLCDRGARRASPGLDTDPSGLGLSFLYPGNVRFPVAP